MKPLLILLALTCFSQATIPLLPPGGDLTPGGTTFAQCPEVGGSIIRDQLLNFEIRHPTLNTLILSGRIQDRVIRNSDGRIVFSPRLRDLSAPDQGWVTRVEFRGFANVTLGAEYRVDGSGQTGPERISRSADGNTLVAHHGSAIIVPPDDQRTIIFSSRETDFALGGSITIFASNDFGGSSFQTTLFGTASRKVPASSVPQPEELRPQLPEVILNQTFYADGDSVTATVRFNNPSQIDQQRLALIFGGQTAGNANETDELEVVPLDPTNDPLVFVTSSALQMSAGSPATQADGQISSEPGEVFVAMLGYRYFDPQQNAFDLFAADWGSVIDPNPATAQVEVRPGLALTDDELNPEPGAKPIGTLFFEGDVGPVQVASRELLFFPKDDDQLSLFLDRTKGTIAGFEGHPGGPITPNTQLPSAGEAWFVIAMQGDPAKIATLPQMRALVGEQSTLSASNEDTLALVASAMELWAEGFLVGLHPRMQVHTQLVWPEALKRDGTARADAFGTTTADDLNAAPIRNEVFGFRQSWAFLQMFDYDRNKVPVGVIDSGFAPNPDFKTFHAFYAERNLSNGTSGIGSAQTPQEVGNSFFGDKAWHGNGTVTTISGVGGNRFGAPGIAAPTAVPKLYHMGLTNFALGFGSAIEIAVNDGCSVINISAGYPCRVLSVLGNDDICSPGGRAAFSLKLGAAVRGAAAAACAAGGLLDAIIPGLGAVTCASAITTAEVTAATLFASVFLGSTRGPVERAVTYATERGVPIVASAGNRLSASTLGALAPFVNYENSNIDDWQVIPAVIPDVIAVGAIHPWDNNIWDGEGDNFYANLHFWGDSVDIWAPIYTGYYAPEDGEVDPDTVPAADHIHRSFGGTSCAAPVITGVIANMMAVDPSLDRRFAPPAELPNLTSRILTLLTDNAYQAGDPEAPDSADDRILVERNEDTDEFETIEMPDSLLADLVNRRNYVNSFRTLRAIARSRGLLEYADLGYHWDLGRHDAIPDTAAPDGVLLPLYPNAFTWADELGEMDQDFWFQRMPSFNLLYRTHYTFTIPLRENPDRFLVNGARGTLVSTTTDEQTLTWRSREYWRDAVVPTLITGDDTLFKLEAAISSRPTPDPDRFDFGFSENDSLGSASPVSNWQSVPPRGLLEAQAWELCLENLNIHSESDVDFYQINFPSLLGIPTSCVGIDPWITISLDPPTPGASIRVYSRSGGETRLLARGAGDTPLRLDCLEYLGRLPLFVEVDSPSFLEYALKVRWSKPDQETVDRLTRIREANAEGRNLSEFARRFPPGIPSFLGLPNLIPDLVTNPNPAGNPVLDSAGRHLFSSLMTLEIPPGFNGGGLLAVLSLDQSLRLELVGPNESVVAINATPDHGFNPDPSLINGNTRYLPISFGGLAGGTYLIRISGHRPGDAISLYASETLLGQGQGSAISMETILDGNIGQTPAELPDLPGFSSLNASFTALRPAGPVGQLRIARARQVSFQPTEGHFYQIETLGRDGIWEPFGLPLFADDTVNNLIEVPIGSQENQRPVRVTNLTTGKTDVTFQQEASIQHLLYQSAPLEPAILKASSHPGNEAWSPLNNEARVGDGSQLEWFVPSTGFERRFFRVEDQ